MSKKSKKVTEQPKHEEPAAQVKSKAKEKPVATPEPVPSQPAVEPEPFDMQKELLSIKAIVIDLLAEVAILVASQRPLRRPTANGKVQIMDKQTGKIYPSKNNAYQSLLKSGDLTDLVDQGVFGPEPGKNTFGWYALVKALPDRFEEMKPE
jgi:transglutaminase/protease-like cytokinesis protein 3